VASVPSLLYPDGTRAQPPPLQDRSFASDLGLDQVFSAAVSGREKLGLDELFFSPLPDLGSLSWRHEVLEDLERAEVMAATAGFCEQMSRVRETLSTARSLHSNLQAERVFLDAVVTYCEAVRALAGALASAKPRSQALRGFAGYFAAYLESGSFHELEQGASALIRQLGEIRYKIHLKGTRVTVSNYEGEADYAKQVEAAFAKFREKGAKDYRAKLWAPLDMSHVDAKVLELVARLNPGPFGALHHYCLQHQDFIDEAVVSFERGAHFYLAYLAYIAPLRERGLRFCRPHVKVGPGPVRLVGAFDLALAAKLASTDGSGPPGVVPNDFEVGPGERAVVVTGPNSGGKTTFCRAVGQAHYLASLGLPVPAELAEVVLVDAVFTSFVQTEALAAARSHFEDELLHFRDILERATERSVVVMNESFSSTTLQDAQRVGRAVLAKLVVRGCLTVFVTFVEELATANEAVVSMAAVIDPADPLRRTYKFVRKPPEGRAYAALLAARYGLSFSAVKERVAP